MATMYARKRKQLTPEQLEASKTRRETITRLARTIGKMSEDERMTMASRMPVVTCEGHRLSPYNVCLVVSQQPDATVVGGFQQWQKEGRQVKKGGKGCGIFVPKYEKEGTDEQGQGVAPEQDRRFIMVYVYDITMTEPSTREG